VTPHGLSGLYESLRTLAPAAVFLDDIDLIAGDRRGSAGPVLREFLTHLDGFRPSAPVVTVATTNASKGLDPALVRPGRFDAVIEILPPLEYGAGLTLRDLLDVVATGRWKPEPPTGQYL
jgi:transitional endoplasmic reticulum ATPase